MADKAISELIAAAQVTPTDLFVLEQSGTAKKLSGQVLENWLVSFADGHGGIQSIVKANSNGLVDTYRITLADTTTFDFVVTNGKGIENILKTDTSDLVDTYTIAYNDGSSITFTVTNGAKGEKGDNAYLWIKYASQKPTASSHSFGNEPDAWMGIYYGNLAEAPTDWSMYDWYNIKGEKGDIGLAAELTSSSVMYQSSSSGTIIPSGIWSNSVPDVAPGFYLWTRVVKTFNSGEPITSYSVSRMGIDGSGAVSTVNSVNPDPNGNVLLTADQISISADNNMPVAQALARTQESTEFLSPETVLADDDYLPFYDTSAVANKRMLWRNIVAKIRTVFFGSLSGFLKADGTGVLSASETIKAEDIADAAVTLAKLADDVTAAALGGVTMTKLWENASPASEFAAQTVAVDFTDYTLVLLRYAFSTTAAEYDSVIGGVGETLSLMIAYGGNNNVGTRPIKINSNNFEADVAVYNTVYDDKYIIPVAIYGIKGVN